MIAELVASTPDDQGVPNKAVTDRAVGIVVYGENITVGNTVTIQQTGDSGTNVASQSSEGDSAVVPSGQAVQGDDDAVAGRDNLAANENASEGWWAGTRKRGVLITITTVNAAAGDSGSCMDAART